MNIQKLKVSEIIIKDRLREADKSKVDKIKSSILRVGLINPITVSNMVLVAGLHRLEAHRALGIEEIDCHVIDDDYLLKKEIEIDENLHRNELTILEKGKMEAIKKSNEVEWQKRQYVIPYEGQTPADTVYEYVQIDSITPEAKINLIGSEYENNKEFLLSLSALSEKEQVSITSNLSINGVEDYLRIERLKEMRERYPDKDKNQIKFQTDSYHFEKALELTKKYKWKSIPDLARRLFEMYLKAVFKDECEKSSDELDLMEVFEGYETASLADYDTIKRGTSI